MLYLQTFDIVMLSETWLKEQDSDSISLNNYNAFHTVRKHLHHRAKRASGGITIFVRKHIKAEIVIELCDHFVVLKLDILNRNITIYI